MTRDEIEKKIRPILRNCLRQFGEFSDKNSSEAEFDAGTMACLQPDVRRISLLISMAQSVLGDSGAGEGLEIGCGYGYLLFPMALFFPNIRWTAVEHPGRAFVNQEEFRKTLCEYHCQFAAARILEEPLPFPDEHFSIVTFSEVMEHLPPERLNFVLSEIARVTRPGGVLLASSPNLASLENRLRLLKGKSVLDMPDEMEAAKGMFGHIRMYTQAEVQAAMMKYGFTAERCVFESNNSGFRGTSPSSWKRQIRRLYESLEGKMGFLRGMGDTWHIAFRRAAPR
jgi:SAM-dependent methyltransferase